MVTKRIKILLIEDNLAYARYVSHFLNDTQADQWDVKHVQQIEEALKALDEEYFDVVLSDLTLPGTDGPEAILKLKQKSPKTPLVILSAAVDKAAIHRALNAGATNFLPKDKFSGNRLREIIDCS